MKASGIRSVDCVRAMELTKVNDAHKGVCIVAELALFVDVAKVEQIELLLTSSTSCVDGKQDGPSYAAADKADEGEHLEVSEI